MFGKKEKLYEGEKPVLSQCVAFMLLKTRTKNQAIKIYNIYCFSDVAQKKAHFLNSGPAKT